MYTIAGKKYFFLLTSFCLCISLCAQSPIIPRPENVIPLKGSFVFSSVTCFDLSSGADADILQLLNNQIEPLVGYAIKGSRSKFTETSISFLANNQLKEEEYHITVSEKSIAVQYGTRASGYAISSIIQLIHFYKSKSGISIPCMLIKDAPEFPWRGMHLDVVRHFFSVNFIKKYIDLLALYKMNSFHWHLTDDQGWRIEIKKHPLLTKVGAWRTGSMVGHYSNQQYDTIRHGGFYTQKEIREVVQYAAQRNISVVPEVEMPGHSLAALSAYPQLACKDSTFAAAKGWGVFDDVYCTKEETFSFLEDVLEEVCSLFPSEYIHIGGDEVPKTRWKSCMNCQARMKSEGLKNEEELQSYFIRRIEKFINSKGKKIIGWDEILEGGLAPNAAVMSWRGIEGGERAAQLKHYVVMSPGSHCYFDHYQSTPEFEPVAIGGFTPLEKVYAYDPLPASLTVEEKQYILGAQANIWTEYITSPQHAEYMALPRMAALAEALWTKKENKEWTDFANRLQSHFKLLEDKKINFSKALYDVRYKTLRNNQSGGLAIELNSAVKGIIRYTLDKSEPVINSPEYQSKIILKTNCVLKAALFINNQRVGKILEKKFYVNSASGKTISFKTQPSKYYNKTEGFSLVNGVLESVSNQREMCTGWCNTDADFIIHFEKEIAVKKLTICFLNDEQNAIFEPLEIKIAYNDDESFISLLQEKLPKDAKNKTITFSLPERKMSSLRIKGINPMKATDSWMLFDEILVE